MSNANLGGWGRVTWNSGAWDTPATVEVTGVSSSTAVGSIQVDITVEVAGVSAATAVGSIQADITIEVTGLQASTALGTVNIWLKIIPGQTAGWNPITYTQSPEWTKIAA